MRWAPLSAAVGLCALAAAAPATRWTITDPGQRPVPLPRGGTAARELSGITWAGGTRYYAVSDKVPALFSLSVAVDPRRGTITSASVDAATPRLAGSKDLEGIAYNPTAGTVLVSDETGPAIREYRVADGALVRTLDLPPVYRNARNNLSLESLSMDPEHRTLWTANEETLSNDGPISSRKAGSVVRLQRFDHTYRPTGQWAYVTDPTFGAFAGKRRRLEGSGVSDLVALPGGGLIVLERAYGLSGLRIRLYEVDFSGATDVTDVPSLGGTTYTPVGKRLLWERRFPDANFEGAALGPELEDGARSLVLIADDGQHMRQALYALTLRPAH
jgi:hypothetical protein